MPEWTVIIPAGGSGKRMGSDIPKQFMELEGIPLLFHTIRALHVLFNEPQIIVPIPLAWMDSISKRWNEVEPKILVSFIEGGQERYFSVLKSLPWIESDNVAIHDAVRPFVNLETIENCKSGLISHKAVVPVLPIKDSIRSISNNGSMAVDRTKFVVVHTPQCFKKETILAAYNVAFDPEITDDASLVERIGEPVFMVSSNEENIKITTPQDWDIANQWIRKK